MAYPTKEEYEKALKNVAYLGDSIIRETKRRENIINELCASQKVLDEYKDLLNKAKEVVQKYEIYQEISEKYK